MESIEEKELKEYQEIKEMLDRVDLSKWQISPSEVEIDRNQILGKGAFGRVYGGKCRGKKVAIKKLYRQNLKYVLDLILEVDTMSQLLHPNVLLFMAVCTEVGNLMIITEYMSKGSIDTLLKKEPHLSLGKRLGFCKDAALGMNWLHSCTPPVLHRDLKPSNLLVDQNYNVKVCDFGLSIHKVEEWSKEKPKGSPLYMAPECLLGNACDEASDVYSFGYIVWEIVTRKVLFPDINDEKTLKTEVCLKQLKPPIPIDVPLSVQKIIHDCFLMPTQRPTFKQLCDSLDHAIIDTVLHDKDAIAFWKKFFLGRDTVPYSEFESMLVKFLDFKILEEALRDSFKSLLGLKNKPKNEQNITLEKFSEILSWFGPMISKTPKTEPNFLEKYQMDFLSLKGFHPTATRDSSIQLLNDKKTGTYLFRFGSRPGDFVLVRYLSKDKTKMYRLAYSYDPDSNEQGIYTFEDKSTYSSLSNFAESLRALGVTIADPLLWQEGSSSGYTQGLKDEEDDE